MAFRMELRNSVASSVGVSSPAPSHAEDAEPMRLDIWLFPPPLSGKALGASASGFSSGPGLWNG